MNDANHLRLLSLMLRIPDEESLPLLEKLANDQPWMQIGLYELAETPLSQWQHEYRRLFVEQQHPTAAPPYESVYRRQTDTDPVVDRLNALYRDAGLNVESTPADYLGTQLEVAAHLAESTDPRAHQWQIRLWRDHLLHWIPAFVDDLCQNSQLLIYRLWGGQLALLSNNIEGSLVNA
ncbi:MAG: molecular chaperone TorD family protein [Candidatus Thiodiazotropha sp. (ex Monitilora ramsayi)]|nr:molecular chaperone TorD family protein [Candidatus Thiodiazotropha sp. (ex Monitilora ramsayi)]